MYMVRWTQSHEDPGCIPIRLYAAQVLALRSLFTLPIRNGLEAGSSVKQIDFTAILRLTGNQ
jgi:hypothetical protein